jgi:hypothetical protein
LAVGAIRNIPQILNIHLMAFSSSSVLSARSRVFSAMFQSQMKEAVESKVYVVDCPGPAFAAAMHAVYTGELHIPRDAEIDGRDIWRIADKVCAVTHSLPLCLNRFSFCHGCNFQVHFACVTARPTSNQNKVRIPALLNR